VDSADHERQTLCLCAMNFHKSSEVIDVWVVLAVLRRILCVHAYPWNSCLGLNSGDSTFGTPNLYLEQKSNTYHS
jgi:hypothetical protein